jgi:hypothetical protein
MHVILRSLAVVAVLLTTGCAANGAIITANDPFLGPTRSFARYLDSGHYTAVGMTEAKGKQTVQVLVVERGQAHDVGKPGDVGEFKLGEQTLTLHAKDEAKPVTNATPYEIFTQWIVNFELTPEQLAEFTKEPLVATKVNIGDRFYQLALGPDDTKVVKANAVALAGPPK